MRTGLSRTRASSRRSAAGWASRRSCDGAAARDAAEAALAEAAALIEQTGATSLAPALCEWRAELAAVLGDDAARADLLCQAQEGYEAIGAPRHAARLGVAVPTR